MPSPAPRQPAPVPAALEGRGPELARCVVDEVTALAGGSLRPETERRLVDLTLHGYDVFLAMVAGDDEAGRPDRMAELVGHLFDDMDVSLEDALSLSRHLHQLLREQVREVAERHLATEQVADVVSVGQRFANDLSVALADGWLSAHRQDSRDRVEQERRLLDGLLAAPLRLGEARRIARSLRIELAGPWEVAVLAPLGAGAEESLGRLRQSLWGAALLTAEVDGALVVAVHRGTVTTAWPELPDGVVCGIGGRHADARGVRLSHEQAREALALAHRRGVPQLHFDDTWFDRFLLGSATIDELAAVVLAPADTLSPNQRVVVLQTLEAYLDCGGNVTEMAASLQMHRQSVNYRVNNVRRVFGSALRTPEGRLALHLAVKAAHLGPP